MAVHAMTLGTGFTGLGTSSTAQGDPSGGGTGGSVGSAQLALAAVRLLQQLAAGGDAARRHVVRAGVERPLVAFLVDALEPSGAEDAAAVAAARQAGGETPAGGVRGRHDGQSLLLPHMLRLYGMLVQCLASTPAAVASGGAAAPPRDTVGVALPAPGPGPAPEDLPLGGALLPGPAPGPEALHETRASTGSGVASDTDMTATVSLSTSTASSPALSMPTSPCEMTAAAAGKAAGGGSLLLPGGVAQPKAAAAVPQPTVHLEVDPCDRGVDRSPVVSELMCHQLVFMLMHLPALAMLPAAAAAAPRQRELADGACMVMGECLQVALWDVEATAYVQQALQDCVMDHDGGGAAGAGAEEGCLQLARALSWGLCRCVRGQETGRVHVSCACFTVCP